MGGMLPGGQVTAKLAAGEDGPGEPVLPEVEAEIEAGVEADPIEIEEKKRRVLQQQMRNEIKYCAQQIWKRIAIYGFYNYLLC